MPSRYADVEERMEAQKRFYRDKMMREWLVELDRFQGRGFCYFVGCSDGLIKIGHSVSPNRRLGELRRQTPEKLELLATVPGDNEREQYYHSLFRDHACGGEWFERHPDILAEIERLSAKARGTERKQAAQCGTLESQNRAHWRF